MGRKTKSLILYILAAVLITMLTACQEKAMWVGNSYPGNMEAKYKYLNGAEDVTFNLKEGDTAAFSYNSKVNEGSLSIRIVGPDNETVMELQPNQKGTEELKAEKSGNYKVIITGDKTSGSYDIKWKIKK